MLILQIIDQKYEVVWQGKYKTADIILPHPKGSEKYVKVSGRIIFDHADNSPCDVRLNGRIFNHSWY